MRSPEVNTDAGTHTICIGIVSNFHGVDVPDQLPPCSPVLHPLARQSLLCQSSHFSTTGLLRCDHRVPHSQQRCKKIDCVTSNQDFNSTTCFFE